MEPGRTGAAAPPAPVRGAEAAAGLTGVGALAPPVPVPHCCLPRASHAGGWGARAARVFRPSLEKVGLLQRLMSMFWATTPGMRRTCWSPACTRLIGSGE